MGNKNRLLRGNKKIISNQKEKSFREVGIQEGDCFTWEPGHSEFSAPNLQYENENFIDWVENGMPTGTELKVIRASDGITFLATLPDWSKSVTTARFSDIMPSALKMLSKSNTSRSDDCLAADVQTEKHLRKMSLTMPTLDLHGQTYGEAALRVRDFILTINQNKQFPVCIVTGKSAEMKRITLKTMGFLPYLKARGGHQVVENNQGSIVFDYIQPDYPSRTQSLEAA